MCGELRLVALTEGLTLRRSARGGGGGPCQEIADSALLPKATAWLQSKLPWEN